MHLCDLAEAHAVIGEVLEKVCNQKCLHSALGYVPPAEFEAQLATQNQVAAARQLSLCVLRGIGKSLDRRDRQRWEQELWPAPSAFRPR